MNSKNSKGTRQCLLQPYLCLSIIVACAALAWIRLAAVGGRQPQGENLSGYLPMSSVVSASTDDAQIPTLEERLAESQRLVREYVDSVAATAPTIDMGHRLAMHRIGWAKPFHDPRVYIEAMGAEPTEELLADVQEVLDVHAPVLADVQHGMHAALSTYGLEKVVRGEYMEPAVPGELVAPPYNGAWTVFARTGDMDHMVVVQVFPGECPDADDQYREIAAVLDAAYWDIAERIK